jgi:5-methylcytosine-specific restriction endonuclease McrA
MQRKTPLKTDPAKTRAWQERSKRLSRAVQPRGATAVETTTKDTPTETAGSATGKRRRKPRRNDAPWRSEVFALRGAYCRVPGCVGRDLQCDHLIPRSQGGPSVVPNGVPWCQEHHDQKTAHQLRIRPEWLDGDQLEWLAAEGHAVWDETGEVRGRHRRLFTRRGEAWQG